MALPDNRSQRRNFLRFLAASPILGYAGLEALLGPEALAQAGYRAAVGAANGVIIDAPEDWVTIKSVREALSVFDFQVVAKAKLPPQHYAYLNDGVFLQETEIANRVGFAKYQIRPRRLSGFGNVDQSINVFGVKWEAPLFLCPGGASNVAWPNGAEAEARAAENKRTLAIGAKGMNFGAGVPMEHTTQTPVGHPLIWGTTQGVRPLKSLLQELDAAGCPVFVWNIDHGGGGNQLGGRAIQRLGVPNLERSKDVRCNSCHKTEVFSDGMHRITLDDPMSKEIGVLGGRTQDPRVRTQTWDDVKRVKDDMPRMKLVLKGILTHEDAELAVKHGADGIEVSNHGAHSDAFGRGAIECLPEVVKAVGGKIPVFIDGGFRSGADIYKALALGATAVGIGRPKHWGLAAFGQEGVETVIEILRRELQSVMADTGASTVAKIARTSLVTR